MASGVYNIWKSEIMKKTVDMVNDTLKVMLLNNSHSFNADDTAMGTIDNNELAATGGYSTGGATMASQAVTVDNTDDEGVFDAADTAWTSASFTAYHAVIWDDTHASDIPIASIDFGGAQTVSSGTFTIQWAAEGIININ